ncbi:hypothetical protein CBW65_10245 [Tumebacillus avium]|uniref:Uncharacterized protein n=1 Tax=Tumebacillus avium TaxID=1903704 RepID=A0A1Y0IND8_9BACL|nr:CBO0543 family protein [Tumebacillus avium]ARU61336.1 hypothetical protein CBW65_10245 [Tumebacillus avium]
MSFLVLFALSWAVFYLFVDFQRLRELYPCALVASLLGIITDLVMLKFQLWGYHTPLVPALYIPLVLDSSIYPVTAVLFTQYLPLRRNRLVKFGYIVAWSLPSVLLEWTFLLRDEMQHYRWWTLWHSFFADLIIFFILYGIHLLVRPYFRSSRSGEVSQ